MIVSQTGGASIAPPAQGVHIAICTRVIDLGTQETTYKGKPKRSRKVLIGWELPDEPMIEVNGEMMPTIVQSRMTASLSEKAELYGLLVSWRGRKFTDQELKGFDLKNIIGAGCQLQLVHTDDGRFANVQGIMPLPKGLPKPVAKGMVVNLDLDPDRFEPRAFAALGDKLKEMIASTDEYKIATGAMRPETDSFAPDFDDEIPF